MTVYDSIKRKKYCRNTLEYNYISYNMTDDRWVYQIHGIEHALSAYYDITQRPVRR